MGIIGSLLVIGLFIVVYLLIISGLEEKRIMNKADKMIDENAEYIKEVINKEYGEELIK